MSTNVAKTLLALWLTSRFVHIINWTKIQNIPKAQRYLVFIYRTTYPSYRIVSSLLCHSSHEDISPLTCSAVVPLVPHLADAESIVAGPCADAALAAPVRALAKGGGGQIKQ